MSKISQDLINAADELAAKNKLSRKTLSVREDDKKKECWITEEVFTLEGEGTVTRTETYYFKNLSPAEAKAVATYKFLGQTDLLQGKVIGAPAEEPAETPAAKPAKGKGKGKGKGKAAAKPAAEEKAPNVKYQKSSKEHSAFVKAVVEDKLGDDWKKNKDKYAVVKELVDAINDKVDCTDAKGDVLGSFVDFCKDFIEEKYSDDTGL